LDYIQARGGKVHTRRQTRAFCLRAEGKSTRVTGLAIAEGETEEIITADAYLAACDVPGIQRLLPAEWRQWSAI
jgi:zeta-carotene desaturase